MMEPNKFKEIIDMIEEELLECWFAGLLDHAKDDLARHEAERNKNERQRSM